MFREELYLHLKSFPGISGKFREIPGNSGKFREIREIPGKTLDPTGIFLRAVAKNVTLLSHLNRVYYYYPKRPFLKSCSVNMFQRSLSHLIVTCCDEIHTISKFKFKSFNDNDKQQHLLIQTLVSNSK